MNHETFNNNPENTGENEARPTDSLEELAGDFNPEQAKENIAARTKEIQAEAASEKRNIPLTHESTPFGEIVGPRTPALDEYLSRHHPKLRRREQFMSKEHNDREWSSRSFKLTDHEDVKHAKSSEVMTARGFHVLGYYPGYGDHSEKAKTKNVNNALEYALAFYDDDYNDAWQMYNNPQGARSDALRAMQGQIDHLLEWPHGQASVSFIESEVNQQIIQGKTKAIVSALSHDRFMMPSTRKKLEEELTALRAFDPDEYFEDRKKLPESQLGTPNEATVEVSDMASTQSEKSVEKAPIGGQEQEQEQEIQSTEAEESNDKPARMPLITSDPDVYIAAVATQKTVDGTNQQLHSKDEFLEQKIEDFKQREKDGELSPDEMRPITAEAASLEAIDHLEELSKTMDKKDILNMIYGEDWTRNYDRIVNTLFNGDRFQAGQEMVFHMSSEEISANLVAILEMIDKNDDSFPIRNVLYGLSGNGKRGISPQEKEILAHFGYNDYTLRSFGL